MMEAASVNNVDRSLQELLVLNSGFSPGAAHSSLIQSVHLLGSRAYELYANIDCPLDGSMFIDFVHYVHHKPTVYRRAACLFEESRGAPLRRRRYRHQPDGTSERKRADGVFNNCLVVRTILVTGYYEYVIDYVFHQNGVIETVCSVTGYAATHFYTGSEDMKFGFQVRIVIEFFCFVLGSVETCVKIQAKNMPA